jgi:16S rRNA (guanine966-N2)-methyltransferase
VVFADPPYPLASEELEHALARLVANDWVAPGSLVVVERSVRSVEPAWPQGLVREREKTYGETVLWYLRADPGTRPHSQPDDQG